MSVAAVYVGTFVKRSGTGTQVVTGLVDRNGDSFVPKGFIFSTVLRTATGFESSDMWQVFGVDDGSNVAAVSHFAKSGAWGVTQGHDNTSSLYIVDGDGSVNSAGHVSDRGTGQFTVNWTTAAGHPDILINFMAFGGSSVACEAGDVAVTSGDQTITHSLGSTPGVVFFLSGCGRSASDHTNATSEFGAAGVGWMCPDGTQGTACNDTADAVPTQKIQRYTQSGSRCIASWGAAFANYEASFVSMDSSAFTVHWNVVNTGGRLSYLAISGLSATAGYVEAPSSSGSTSVTTAGFGGDIRATAALFASVGIAHSASVGFGGVNNTGCELSFGLCDANNNQRVNWTTTGAKSTGTEGQSARYESNTAAIITANYSSTLQSTGVVTMTNFGFNIAWTISSADLAQVNYLLIGGSAAAENEPHFEDGRVSNPLVALWEK